LNIKKRIVPIVLFFALIASSIAVGQWKVNAAADVTPPYISGISVDYSKVCSGQDVTITVNASDDSGAVDYAYVEYLSPSQNYIYYAYLYPDANGKLVATMPITSEDELGVYKPLYIAASDAAENISEVYNVDFYSTGDLRAMIWGNFEVTTLTQTPPRGLSSVNVTTHAGSDGKITGTSILMEYAKQYSSSYTPAPGKEITGLSEGMYQVRYAAKDGLPAGPSTLIYVKGPEFDVDNGVLLKYNGPGGDVVIPDNMGIASIGSQAFSGCSTLRSVTMPDSINSIGGRAFSGSSLSSINLSKNLTSIGIEAFRGCNNLTNVVVPSGVTSIGWSAFDSCISLASITLPDGLTSIGNGAFWYCTSLTSINLPSGMTKIESSTFYNCTKLTNVILPATLTSIDSSAFGNCSSLKSLDIPAGVQKIGDNAFSSCSNLETVNLPASLKVIDYQAFYGCKNLKNIVLPENLTTIGNSAFNLCTSITSIKIPAGATIGNSAFFACYSLENVVLPDGLTKIGDYCFQNCTSLSKITLPASMVEVGTATFDGCSKLSTIIAYPLSDPTAYTGTYRFIPSNAVIYTLPGAIGYDTAPWSSFMHKYITPDSIELTTMPLRTEYYTGQSINLSGIVVTGTYGNIKAQVPVTAANISGFNSSSPATGQKVTVNVDGKTATFDVNITDKAFAPESTGNIAMGKTITSSSAFTNGTYATDGSAVVANYANITNPGLQWVQVDLGETKNLCEIDLWHYFGDTRAYHDVIVQLSDDSTFGTGVTTVYNNDRDNSAKLGAGVDFEYAETTAGLNIAFNTAKARYVRIYSNGSTANTYNHISEIGIYGWMPIIQAESISLSKASAEVGTGETYALAANFLPANTTNKGVTWSSSNTSVATVSTTGAVTGIKPGTATITATSVDGGFKATCEMTVTLAPSKLSAGKTVTTSSAFNNAAFVTDGYKGTDKYSDSINSGLQYVQMDLGAYYDVTKVNLWHYFGDGRTYHDVIVQVSNDPTFATDVTTVFNNDTNNSALLGTGKDAEYAETSAGKTMTFDKVNARYVRIYSNGSSINGWNHFVEAEVYGFDGPVVSAASISLNKTTDAITTGGTSTLTAKVMPLNTTNKNVTWSSSDETVATVSVAGVVTGVKAGTATITATTADGSSQKATCDVTVTLAPKNLSAGKAVTTSSAFNNAAFVTDGYKGTDKYSDSVNSGLQYVQMDLGAYYDLTKINLWHYFGDGRTYKDVIVQVSNDLTFATDVTTVFNNDTNNSALLGTGKDAEYAETSAGKTMTFDKVNARYVRIYSNGSSVNAWNHVVEAEVYGFDGPVVSAASVSLNKTSDTIAIGGSTALTAKVMPLNTTNKNVTWSSSDTSVAAVSTSGVVTGAKVGTATITATTVDGSFTATCTVTVTEPVGNLAAGKAVTSSSFTSPSAVTDGYKSTDQYAGSVGSGLSWIQVDMGASLDVNHVNLWHYFGDGRTYHDVIVQFSDDPNFVNNVTTVYNNDKDNTAGFGIGKESEYAETSAGKSIDFTAVKARYARIYSNGSTANGWNHVVEVEISKEVQRTNYAKGAAATTSSSFKNLNVATDNSLNTGYADGSAGLHWIQYDLGSAQDINEINLWHYFLDGRTYHDVVVQVSNDPTFTTDVKTVYNNDTNNSAGLGIGTDAEYAETSAGKCITFASYKAQYVRLYSNGSSINTYNHYVEVEICNNLASGMQATSSPGFTSLNSITDGLKTGYSNGSTGLQWIQYDLGSVQDINEVNLWHYYLDGRTYHDVIVQVSNDPDFLTGVTTVYNNDTNNSALLGAGSDSEYAETAAGKKITFSTKKAQYVRIYSNGSSINAYNHYVEVEICNNLAAGKTAAATSSAFTNMGSLTDGNKSAGYAEGLISGLQWVQLDLGSVKSVNRINLWHYYLDGRTYHDVIVQVSNDPTFSSGVKTVYNNDKDNSAGFGAGSDSEYAETSAGKTIDFSAADAQYVRIYSNGSTANGWNHYVEVEVLGN